MYEELIEDLSRRGLSNGTTLGYHSGLMEAAADALKDVTAQLTAKDAEIERTGGYVAIPKWQYDAIRADLTRVTAERDALKEKAILWGTKLIEFGECDARATPCPECGFPIADYGVDADIYCSWCKAKSSSPNYVTAGPGYCTTSEDRKSKTYDRLFRTGHTPAKQDEEG